VADTFNLQTPRNYNIARTLGKTLHDANNSSLKNDDLLNWRIARFARPYVVSVDERELSTE